MNEHTHRENNASTSALGPFREFFAAVAKLDVANMGARSILAALVKQAGTSERAKALGLDDTLTVYDIHGIEAGLTLCRILHYFPLSRWVNSGPPLLARSTKALAENQ